MTGRKCTTDHYGANRDKNPWRIQVCRNSNDPRGTWHQRTNRSLSSSEEFLILLIAWPMRKDDTHLESFSPVTWKPHVLPVKPLGSRTSDCLQLAAIAFAWCREPDCGSASVRCCSHSPLTFWKRLLTGVALLGLLFEHA